MSNKLVEAKSNNDIHLMILQDLLKLEDNKYCVDCDAKGPRWASTNLGVFLCIRCAGIHRKLGVHISRVKSVTLDSWTAEQIATMKTVGNSRGRAVYEAELADSYCRPQSTNALEAFIRSKYEMRRYIARNYVEEKPDVELIHSQVAQIQSQQKKSQKSPVNSGNIQLTKLQSPPSIKSLKSTTDSSKSVSRPVNPKEAKPQKNDLESIFGDFSPSPLENVIKSNPPINQTKTSSSDLEGLDFGLNSASKNIGSQKQESFEKSKESILALFNSPTSTPSYNNIANQWTNLGTMNSEPLKSPTIPPPSYGSIFSPGPASPNNLNSQSFQVSWPCDSFFSSSVEPPANPTVLTPENNFANFSAFAQTQPVSAQDFASLNFNPVSTQLTGDLFQSQQQTAVNGFNNQLVNTPRSPNQISKNDNYLASIQSQLASLSVMKQN